MLGLPSVAALADAASLDEIVAGRSNEDKARDVYRHPVETLTFFGIEPGMTVVETLPGRGWYTKILAPYLGAEGRLLGANYTAALFQRMMGERWEERRARIESFPETFPELVAQHAEAPPQTGTFLITEAPADLMGQVDQVLFLRALHHLNRFEPSILDAAAAEAFALLKPGGVVGITQHRAPETASDTWANGDNGYLKPSRVIEAFEGAGFTLAGTSEINANPKDQPTEQDRVWRLPPSLALGEENRDAYLAIGESDRMTLKFVKPE
jgi:predicted methyltransferase